MQGHCGNAVLSVLEKAKKTCPRGVEGRSEPAEASSQSRWRLRPQLEGVWGSCGGNRVKGGREQLPLPCLLLQQKGSREDGAVTGFTLLRGPSLARLSQNFENLRSAKSRACCPDVCCQMHPRLRREDVQDISLVH